MGTAWDVHVDEASVSPETYHGPRNEECFADEEQFNRWAVAAAPAQVAEEVASEMAALRAKMQPSDEVVHLAEPLHTLQAERPDEFAQVLRKLNVTDLLAASAVSRTWERMASVAWRVHLTSLRSREPSFASEQPRSYQDYCIAIGIVHLDPGDALAVFVSLAEARVASLLWPPRFRDPSRHMFPLIDWEGSRRAYCCAAQLFRQLQLLRDVRRVAGVVHSDFTDRVHQPRGEYVGTDAYVLHSRLSLTRRQAKKVVNLLLRYSLISTSTPRVCCRCRRVWSLSWVVMRVGPTDEQVPQWDGSGSLHVMPSRDFQ